MKAEMQEMVWLMSEQGRMFQHPSSLYFDLPCKVTDTPMHKSLSGYGRRIPTRYMVQYQGHWRRVYCCNYGNSGTLYIGSQDDWIATVQAIDGQPT